MAEMFQVVGGAMACVDLALKAYKEIERFRLRVQQADEVGAEMASKYGRLTKTLDDVHSALKCRKDQLNGQVPSEGEVRVWVNIHDSLVGMRKAVRSFKRELEHLDSGRDITKRRKWVDRAIWQLKLNKRLPLFDHLEEAANSRVDELTLSLSSMQIFMHTETNQYMQLLIERMDSIEATLGRVSMVRRSPATGTAPLRRTNRKQLNACLRAAHALVDKRNGQASGPGAPRHSRGVAAAVDDDRTSLWEDTDGESVFSKATSPLPRRGTVQVAPDELPAAGLDVSGPGRSPKPGSLDDFSDTSDDDLDDLPDHSSDDGDDDDSVYTEITNIDDVHDTREQFETAPNSLSPAVSHTSDRNGSVTSTYSNVICTGIEQRCVDPLMRAIKSKDATSVQRVLSADDECSPARRVSITIKKIPILHMVVLKEAGPEVIDVLFKSARVDINAVEPDERKSALHWAVKFNRQSCCARLLQAPGVNVDIKDKYEYTPLQSALHLSAHSEADVYSVVKLLLEAGARIPSPLPRGMSNTVETLVKKHEKRRRGSSGSSVMSSPDLARAQTASADRRPSDDGPSSKRKYTIRLGRSFSAKG